MGIKKKQRVLFYFVFVFVKIPSVLQLAVVSHNFSFLPSAAFETLWWVLIDTGHARVGGELEQEMMGCG